MVTDSDSIPNPSSNSVRFAGPETGFGSVSASRGRIRFGLRAPVAGSGSDCLARVRVRVRFGALFGSDSASGPGACNCHGHGHRRGRTASTLSLQIPPLSILLLHAQWPISNTGARTRPGFVFMGGVAAAGAAAGATGRDGFSLICQGGS